VLLVAPSRSYRLFSYCEAARDLGVVPVVASVGEAPLVPGDVPGIRIEPIEETSGAAEIAPAFLSAVSRLSISAVIATDDATGPLSARVAERLGLPHNSFESARTAVRKDLARQALARAGAPVPAFWPIRMGEPLAPQLAPVELPCVVKPLSLSGSRGVIRCNDRAQLSETVHRVARIVTGTGVAPGDVVLQIETYLPGEEVAFEGMLAGGRLHRIALFDKPDPLTGPYFEETFYVTPSRLPESLQARIFARVEEAVRAYGLTHGPIHAELRVHGEDATVLEVAARTIGGDCARLLRFAGGLTLEHLVIRQAAGTLRFPLALSVAAAGVMMLPTTQAGILRRVEGVLAAQRVPGVREVVIAVREGYELIPLPEGGSYLGFVFATGSGPAAVEQALRDAYAELEVVAAPLWRLEGRSAIAG